MVVTDTASYSDIVFGLLTLAGYTYAPQLADLPYRKMWRIDRAADYGPSRLSHDGRPIPLGDGITHYGRISQSLHALRLADEPGCRRQIKTQGRLASRARSERRRREVIEGEQPSSMCPGPGGSVS
jgi:TnpA family transposase